MNRKFFLTLLSSPVLFASMTSMVMMATNPASATQATSNGMHTACVKSPHSAVRKMVCERVANTNPTVKPEVKVAQAPNQPAELQFTDQESDEAIKLFGCDCSVCINAIRSLHGMAPIPVQ
jgi:hypothetical protein